MAQPAKVFQMRSAADEFKKSIKDLKGEISTRQLEDRSLLIQKKGNFAYIWARGSENFLAGMNLLESEKFSNAAFGSHEDGGIFSATLIKKGDNADGK
jgi:hypothetical protein